MSRTRSRTPRFDPTCYHDHGNVGYFDLAEPDPEPEPVRRFVIDFNIPIETVEMFRMDREDNLWRLRMLQKHNLREFAENGRWDLVERGIDELMD